MSSVTGRHGSYATQFLSKSKYPTHWSREAKRRANCKDAVDRRLVLPLETQNWVRALEVLQSRYGRHGSTPEHYQRVVRLLASNVSPHRRMDTCGVVNAIRDKVYSGEIAANIALWVTLIWAYSELQCTSEGFEAAAQVENRFPLSSETRKHVSELLLPMLAREGRVADVEYVVEHFVPEAKRGEEQTSLWISEAAARAGDWQRALRVTTSISSSSTSSLNSGGDGDDKTERVGSSMDDSNRNSVQLAEQALSRPKRYRAETGELQSLFAPAAATPIVQAVEVDKQRTTVGSAVQSTHIQERSPVDSDEGTARDSGSTLPNLSVNALQEIVVSASRDLRWDLALSCFWQLHMQEGEKKNMGVPQGRNPELVPDRVVHSLMNSLGQLGRWEETLQVFSSLYLHDTSERRDEMEYDQNASKRNGIGVTRSRSPSSHRSLTRDALNLVFASFPATPQRVSLRRDDLPATSLLPRECTISQFDAPEVIIKLLNQLLMSRDDVVLTDWVSATAAPALVQVGEWDRALHILKNAPYFQRITSQSPSSNRAARHEKTSPIAEERLLACLLNQHVNGSAEATLFTIVHFLRVFPPAYVRVLPPPPSSSSESDHVFKNLSGDTEKSVSNGGPEARSMADWSEEQILENMEQRARNATSVRPSRHHYFPKASAATLTQMQEDAMRRDHLRSQRHKEDAFSGNLQNAHHDPRPIPKGLHDTANGWNFYGNGGEMVFMNNRRTAHPFSMHPKVMRKLADPFRGWSPKENSVWAHRERVIKWNKKSAV